MDSWIANYVAMYVIKYNFQAMHFPINKEVSIANLCMMQLSIF